MTKVKEKLQYKNRRHIMSFVRELRIASGKCAPAQFVYSDAVIIYGF